MTLRLQGKCVAITGGDQGIGRAIAERLAQELELPTSAEPLREQLTLALTELVTRNVITMEAARGAMPEFELRNATTVPARGVAR